MNSKMKRSLYSKIAGLLGWIGVCYLIAYTGALVSPGLASPEWYDALNKPSWNPPNWLFGPVWSTLYTMMGIAAWIVWVKYGFQDAATALYAFIMQLLLNGLWSQLFFNWHLIGWAFLEIIILLAAILWTSILFWNKQRIAGWLMIPYIAWVAFATVLNGTIWWLNM